ncbi:MAG: hypothetical protein KGJ44_05950, partial [Betaproteobacteria bacterium]|nr:hypothetical protein [Betaproteobacteria bacterium]
MSTDPLVTRPIDDAPAELPPPLGSVREWLAQAPHTAEGSLAAQALHGVFLALGRAHGAADASTLADIAYTLAWAVQRGHSAWPLQRLAPAEQALLSR